MMPPSFCQKLLFFPSFFFSLDSGKDECEKIVGGEEEEGFEAETNWKFLLFRKKE